MCEKCKAVCNRLSVPCQDCGNDTSPTTGIAEYYMVSRHVWKAAVHDGAKILCIGCLEKRLGRDLGPYDFGGDGGFPVNAMEPRSPRLNLRLGWRAGLTHEIAMGEAAMRREERLSHG